MVEEEKGKKKSWWKWAAGAVIADQYINAKIERGVSEIEEKVSERVREELERQEYKKEEKARYAIEKQLEAKERIKDGKLETELINRALQLAQELQRLVKDIQKATSLIPNATKFNKLIDINLKFIVTHNNLISLRNKWGINTTDLQKGLCDCIKNLYAMLFRTAISTLGDIYSKKNKSKTSKKEWKIFDDTTKECEKILSQENLSQRNYEKFIKQLKNNYDKNKVEGFVIILKQAEDRINLRKNVQKVDNFVKSITE